MNLEILGRRKEGGLGYRRLPKAPCHLLDGDAPTSGRSIQMGAPQLPEGCIKNELVVSL